MSSGDSSGASIRGRFITLEGGEGVGKSTQVRHLMERLGRYGIEVLATREPGGTECAEAYREVLLSGKIAPFGPGAEAVMFSAARIDHLDRKILPALEAGITVICDRFIDSTRAYQGATGQLDTGLIAALERTAVGSAMPDLTLILDLPPEIGMMRAAGRRANGAPPDRFEGQGRAFHDALRRAFLDIATRDHDRCCLIDAAKSVDAVADQIWHAVVTRLYPRLQIEDAAPTAVAL